METPKEENKESKHNMVMRNPADLIPHSRNTKKHPKAQINQIRSSIREFGFARPVVIDDKNTILAGHGAVLAALAEQIEEIPCAELIGLSEAQKRAYIVADNKIAENAEWDWNLLGEELKDLGSLLDVKVTGFSEEELKKLFDVEITGDSGSESNPAEDDDEYLVIVECETEDEQEALYSDLKGRGHKVKVMD